MGDADAAAWANLDDGMRAFNRQLQIIAVIPGEILKAAIHNASRRPGGC